jgi:hypothetical protein
MLDGEGSVVNGGFDTGQNSSELLFKTPLKIPHCSHFWGAGSTGPAMTTITDSPAFQHLEAEGRLLKPALNGPTHVPGRVGFRGEIAVAFDPPVMLEAAFAVADGGEATLTFLAGSLKTYKHLPALVEALGTSVKAGGKYFIYVSDLERASRYQIEFNGCSFYVLPIDDTSVYNELIDYLYLDKTRMKKMDTAEKVDAIVQGALKYAEKYENISYEEGLKRL